MDSEFASPLVKSEFRLSIFFHVGYEQIRMNFAPAGSIIFLIDSKEVCLLLKKRRIFVKVACNPNVLEKRTWKKNCQCLCT